MTRAAAPLLLLALTACGSALPPAGGNAPQPPTPAPTAPAPGPPVDPATPPANPAPAAPSSPDETATGGALEVRLLGTWQQSPFSAPERQVIRDREALERLWDRLRAEPRPEVDLGAELVVLAALGERPSGGYDVTVRGARLEGDRLLVEVVETSPGPNCMTTMALTQPAEVVAIPAAGARQVEYRELREQADC